jgi:hypothetical protein
MRRAGIPQGAPRQALVQKVLEQMMTDETRRIAC